MARETKPSIMCASGGPCGQPRDAHSHHQQARDHRDIAEALAESTTFADLRHQNSGDRRAHDARAVEHGRVQSDGVHQIFFAHHIHQEGLPRRNVECIHHSEKRRQHEDVPYPDDACKRKHCKYQRQNHGRNLGPDHDPLAVEAIGDDAAQRRHQKDWNLAGESRRAQQQGRAGQAINQPCLCDALHPCAN